MRLHRIRLKNWRGVDDREIVLAPRGVTVVLGRNESGKTSLLEALDFLIEEYDSAKSRPVLAVKPVHRDEGAEAEAEIECGGRTLKIHKRWHKRPQTTLTVAGASSESHTGREAHERAAKLLGESADLGLWRALRMAQGAQPGAPDLSGQRWLSQALDRAAGHAISTDADTDLFAAAKAEFERHYTATGPKKDLVELRKQREAIAAECARIRDDLTALDRDVERHADLERERAALAPKMADCAARLARLAEDVRRVEGLAASARDAAASARLLLERKSSCDGAVARRRELIDDAAERRRALEAAEAESARSDPPASETAETVAAARAAHDEAAGELAAAQERSTLAERDLELLRSVRSRDDLRARLARIVAAERDAEAAAAVVGATLADDARLAALRRAHEGLLAAEARLEGAAATLRVTASQPVTLDVDGSERSLVGGETQSVVVAGRAVVDAPGAVRVEVTAGAGAAEPRAAADAARRAHERALAECGAESLDEAIRANARRAEAQREVDARARIVAESLGDLAREEIEAKLDALTAQHERDLLERKGAAPLPESVAAAERACAAARDALAHVRAKAAAAATALEGARATDAAAREAAARRSGRLDELRDAVARADAALERARAEHADELLLAAANEAQALAAVAERARTESEASLAEAEPERIEALARAARDEDAALRSRDKQVAIEVASLEGRLSARGEEGLAEALAAKESELAALESRLASREAQAAAAKRLFEVISAERDATRARYVAPWRERIEALGRIVYGATFQVTVADDLSLVSRTLDGVTVPFASLSSGAREQLGVIARLAAAQLVSPEGGVPVILDDALGWSDETRLREMSALLGQAAKDAQIIVLTCLRERYQAVPGAVFASMD